MHIMLSYYGLLRLSDALKIRKEGVSFDKKDECWKVVFNYDRKRINYGFSYLIPSIYNKYMEILYNSACVNRRLPIPRAAANFQINSKLLNNELN